MYQSVDMQDWINKLTLEVILSTAFGVDAKIQMGETTEMLQKVKNIFQIIAILQGTAVCHLGCRLGFSIASFAWSYTKLFSRCRLGYHQRPPPAGVHGAERSARAHDYGH